MLPNTLLVMDAFPLTSNGKVDRKALPMPEADALPITAYTAPRAFAMSRTPTEEVMAELWARVLKVGRMGRNDSFFDLGGHSLLATQLVSRVRETFGVEIAIRTLFEAPTVAGLSARVEAARRSVEGLEAPPLMPQPRAAGLNEAPLSFAQQRLWFLDQLAPGNLFFNVPAAVRLTGDLDMSALQRALAEIVRRHETLRTTFRAEGGVPVQVIAPAEALPDIALPLVDLTEVTAADREAEALRQAREHIRQPFDLAQGSLLRARLFRLSTTEHIAVLVLHHIISDAWSIGVLVSELGRLYRAFVSHSDVAAAPLSIQYADFAHWQREWLQGDVLEKQLAYWKKQLAHLPPVLELPTDRPRPAVQTYNGATERLDLPASLMEALYALSREAGVTLFMTLLAAYQVLLGRYSGQEDFAVGTAIANRQRAEFEPLIGMFVNTLVLRADLTGAPSFRELLRRVRETALGAYAHQDLPFEMLVDALQVERNLSHTPFFQAAFALQNTPFETLELPGLTLSSVSVEAGAAQFDLLLTLSETPNGLSGGLNYNTDLFDAGTAQRMLGHYATLLAAATANPDEPVGRLPLLTEAERRQILVDWNQTAAPTPIDRCAHQLFEAWAERQPDAAALVFGTDTLSYSELNAQADQLAQQLRALGVGPETIVGVSAERSFAQVVSVLGIWKAGGAYLPLDPHYPAERLAFMLADSGTSLVLTQSHLVATLESLAPNTRLVVLDGDGGQQPVVSGQRSAAVTRQSSLAYVIYTSGSTGQPKGALLRHAGLCNLAEAQRQGFDIGPGVRILQFAPLSFDASIWEMVMALGNGAVLVLAEQAEIAGELERVLREQRVNVVTLPPSVLNVLSPDRLPDLRVVVSAGEACSRELAARWAPGRRFFNAYGPTETTVCASWELCDPADPAEPTIGRPILNTRLYILDRHLQPVPVGVPGELCIAGVNVADGYLNRPELTAERFLISDFESVLSVQSSDIKNLKSTIYRTGDLCRYRPDGRIEFLGRLDQQVKVRGHRIELGEIEATLRAHPAVREAVVTARDDVGAAADRRLVAYVQLIPEQQPAGQNGHQAGLAAELREHLRQRLPEYMLPAHFMLVEAFPLSPSGKVDRKRLPAPEIEPAAAAEYVAPRTETEHVLAEMCAGLLGIESVGIHHSFFDLGGHSLLATQLVSRVREAFQVELPLRALFERPTVAGLAELIEQQRRAADSDEARIAALLAQVEQLSDEAAHDLLAAEATD
jgi:amino acid adenylation domain-containing protein